jgi:hypothetical protein
MLSQGWGQLRIRKIRISEDMAAMQDHLQVSLWMTLDPEGMKLAEKVLGSGRVR